MRMKYMKNIACTIIVLFGIFVLTPETVTRADETDIDVEIDMDEPYELVSDATCSISISSGMATVNSYISGKSGTTSTSVTIYLEKFVGGSWQSYTSWSHSGGQSQNNTDSTSVTSGAYRVWMSVTASGTGGTESFNVDGNTAGC